MTTPILESEDDANFAGLRRRVLEYRRMHGYYIVDLVSLVSLRDAYASEEEVLETVFEHFDDQAWPPRDARPSDSSWFDHEVSSSEAKEMVVSGLIGGGNVGHTRLTVPPDIADQFWNEFEATFDPDRRYYTRMSFGDPAYAFLHGAVIVDFKRAGILWIVEGD